MLYVQHRQVQEELRLPTPIELIGEPDTAAASDMKMKKKLQPEVYYSLSIRLYTGTGIMGSVSK